MAVQDAACLVECLRGTASVTAALARYDSQRRPQVARYQWLSRLATPLFQSPSRGAALLRDHLAMPLARMAPFRRRMLSALQGDVTSAAW